MQLVLSWPVRILVVALLAFSIFVDGAGYWYRIINHYPLTGYVADMPPHFGDWQLYIHKGLDIQGGTHMELRLKDLPPGRTASDVQAEEIAIIDRRINSLGVNEPLVAPLGNDRIVVELAGVPASKAQDVLGRTGKLVTTSWVPDPNSTFNGPQGITAGFKPQITPLTGDMITGATAQLDANGVSWVVQLTFDSRGTDQFGKLTTAAVNACPGSGADCPNRHIAEWLDLTQADVDHWDDPGYAAQISLPTEQGGKLITNPTIIDPILTGTAQISGNFTQTTAKDLATLLNAGALPASIEILTSTDVSASLGADSIKKSFAAGLLGLAVVVLFMIAYYRLPGFLASVALIFYAGVVLALFKVIPVTLTLAGLAAFILSVGMAVDANVLIFERFKEEMRAGRTIGAAVDAAVRRAWPAIRDSNISTLMTSTILYVVSTSGPVKGFAFTLAIGVAISLISSIIVTHNLLAIVLATGWARRQGALGVSRG
ncbi:MAG TPA: protein translocase subunit SecD [Candidatus Dormibacteraeota bacterium]